MKAQREAIRSALLSSPDVTAFTDRVYWGKGALDAQTPYVIVRLDDVLRPRTHDMRDTVTRRKMDRQTWEVTAVAEDGDVATSLAEAIDNTLDGRTIIDDTQLLLFDGASDTTDFRQDQSGTILHQVSLTFIVFRAPRA